MMPTAELLVMGTTRSAACPKQLSTKRNRRNKEGKPKPENGTFQTNAGI
jgi:hypothetical protein